MARGRPTLDGKVRRLQLGVGEQMLADLESVRERLEKERGKRITFAEAIRTALRESAGRKR